jgi:hypothetical protein
VEVLEPVSPPSMAIWFCPYVYTTVLKISAIFLSQIENP